MRYPLPALELLDTGDDNLKVIVAGSFRQREGGRRQAAWVLEMETADNACQTQDEMYDWAEQVVERCNAAPAMAARIERLEAALLEILDAPWHPLWKKFFDIARKALEQ